MTTNVYLGLGDQFETEHVAEPRKWDAYSATMACEGADGIEHDQETLVSAWQYLIDTGLCWSLQGWFGRQATAMIEHGLCTRPKAKGEQ